MPYEDEDYSVDILVRVHVPAQDKEEAKEQGQSITKGIQQWFRRKPSFDRVDVYEMTECEVADVEEAGRFPRGTITEPSGLSAERVKELIEQARKGL